MASRSKYALLGFALLSLFQTACSALTQKGISKALEGFTKPITDWLTKEFGIWPAVILIIGAILVGMVWGYRYVKKHPPEEQ